MVDAQRKLVSFPLINNIDERFINISVSVLFTGYYVVLFMTKITFHLPFHFLSKSVNQVTYDVFTHSRVLGKVFL